jgi:hypothetical protein
MVAYHQLYQIITAAIICYMPLQVLLRHCKYGNEANAEKERDIFAATESRGVNALRTVIYVASVFSATGVGIGAFWFINDEKDVTSNTELKAISDLAPLDLESYIHGIPTHLSELSTALGCRKMTQHYTSIF